MNGKTAFRVFDTVMVVVLLASGLLWYFSVMRQLSDHGSSAEARERPAQVAGSEEADPPDSPLTKSVSPIELAQRSLEGRAFETIKIDGRYRTTADEGVSLRVQRREDGTWVSFPLPVVTDSRGRFTAYVELGEAGRYQLRILEPETGHTSRVARLQIV